MRKSLFASVLILASFLSFAQSPSSSKTFAIKQLLEVTGGAKMATAILDNMINTFKEGNIPVHDDMWKEARKEMNMEEFVEMVIPIYDKHYTEDEIKELIAFYNTPVGKKTIQVMPALMQDCMIMGQEWGRKTWEKVQKKLQVKQAPKVQG